MRLLCVLGVSAVNSLLGALHRRDAEYAEQAQRKRLSPTDSYSGSFGLLKSAVSLMLPCPNWGKPNVLRLPGSSVEAVSSGGKRTSELSNASTRSCCSDGSAAKASRADWASPPWRKITSIKLMLRPSWPYGAVEPTPPQRRRQKRCLHCSVVVPFVKIRSK